LLFFYLNFNCLLFYFILLETQPSSKTPWINLTNAKPYIDELYIVQELTREEYFFRIYAENLLSTVWESINFANLKNDYDY
jgi:hypothetical protein